MIFQKAIALISITRPLNLLIGCLSIIVGAVVSGLRGVTTPLVLACVSGCAIMAAGNVLNDYFDAKIDAINKPFRPVPSGKLSKTEAYRYAIILFTFGLFLSIFISVFSCFVAFFTAAGLYFYSYRLKKTSLWGNFVVSLFSGMAFLYGALVSPKPWFAFIPATLAFCFHFGREIIKDLEDFEADKAEGAKTFPIKSGKTFALNTARAILVFLIILTFAPFYLNIYGALYLTIVIFGVDLVIVASLLFLREQPSAIRLRCAAFVLKVDMFIALIAILAGTFE